MNEVLAKGIEDLKQIRFNTKSEALLYLWMLYKGNTNYPLKDITYDRHMGIVTIMYTDNTFHEFPVKKDDTIAIIINETVMRINGDIEYGRFSK